MNSFLLLLIIFFCLQTNYSSAETINYSYDDLDRLRATEYVNNHRIIQDYDEIGNISIRSSYTYNSLRFRYEKSPDCISGTNYNNSTIKCESNPTCSSGVYNSTLDQCVSNGSYSATTSYTCPSGGTLSGTICNVSGSYAATLSGGKAYNIPVYSACGDWYYSSCYESNCSWWQGPVVCPVSSSSSIELPGYGGWTVTLNGIVLGYASSASPGWQIPIGGATAYASSAKLEPSFISVGLTELSSCGGWCTESVAVSNPTTVYGYISPTSKTVGGTYTCPLGGTLSGATCNTSSTYAATPNNTCPSGGTLSGTICNTTTSLNATCTVGILDIASDKCVSSPTCPIGVLDKSLGVCWSY